MIDKLLTPKWDSGFCITELPINILINNGIKALIVDVDGTVIQQNEISIHHSVVQWINNAREHFQVHLLSNNPSRNRIRIIAKKLNLSYTYRASKPRVYSLIKVLNDFKIDSSKAAIIGDRIFTDVLAGNRLGLYTILVKPLGPNGNINSDNKLHFLEKKIATILGGK